MFVAIEGLDGSGKSTVCKIVKWHLDNMGYKVFNTSEPAYSLLYGEEIKDALGGGVEYSNDVWASMYAYNRLDHCLSVIKPFLQESPDGIVVCDRYLLSSLAYQCGNGTTMYDIMEWNDCCLAPDLSIYLDVSPIICRERISERAGAPSVFDSKLDHIHTMYDVAIEYLKLEHYRTTYRVNAMRHPLAVAIDVAKLILDKLK